LFLYVQCALVYPALYSALLHELEVEQSTLLYSVEVEQSTLLYSVPTVIL